MNSITYITVQGLFRNHYWGGEWEWRPLGSTQISPKVRGGGGAARFC